MNKVILMGRLTRDPEVRYSSGENNMAIARYTLPEYLWGYEFVTGQYKDSPENSREKIVSQIKKHFPCDEKVIRKVIR